MREFGANRQWTSATSFRFLSSACARARADILDQGGRGARADILDQGGRGMMRVEDVEFMIASFRVG